MGGNDHAETTGADLILDEHRDIRRRFVKLWQERTCGDPGEPTLAVAWQALASLLESHATTQERDVASI